jgi:hypothetical protein
LRRLGYLGAQDAEHLGEQIARLGRLLTALIRAIRWRLQEMKNSHSGV